MKIKETLEEEKQWRR